MTITVSVGDELAYKFGSAVDRPTGRIDCVPSGITGGVLRYFTPDPLPELLERSRLVEPVSRTEHDPLVALLLLRAAARNKSSGTVDYPQVRRFVAVLQGAISNPGVDDLVSLGMNVNPSIKGLRQNISFVGGIVPSSARHIYAPHTVLPALMRSLADGLTGDEILRCDPLVASVVTGAFGLYMHPFVDGNGRWSRLVAAATPTTKAAHWPAMAGVAFQNACKLPEATSGGLRQRLEGALRFERALFDELSDSGALKRAGELTEVLKGTAKNQAVLYATLGRLYATGSVPIAELRTSFGLSQRAADGMARKAAGMADGMVSVSSDVLDGRHLMDVVDAGVERAIKNVLG